MNLITENFTNYDFKKLYKFLRLAQIKFSYKCAKGFTYDVKYPLNASDTVSDFFNIDFRKSDADYQQKMLIDNYNAQYPNN